MRATVVGPRGPRAIASPADDDCADRGSEGDSHRRPAAGSRGRLLITFLFFVMLCAGLVASAVDSYASMPSVGPGGPGIESSPDATFEPPQDQRAGAPAAGGEAGPPAPPYQDRDTETAPRDTVEDREEPDPRRSTTGADRSSEGRPEDVATEATSSEVVEREPGRPSSTYRPAPVRGEGAGEEPDGQGATPTPAGREPAGAEHRTTPAATPPGHAPTIDATDATAPTDPPAPDTRGRDVGANSPTHPTPTHPTPSSAGHPDTPAATPPGHARTIDATDATAPTDSPAPDTRGRDVGANSPTHPTPTHPTPSSAGHPDTPAATPPGHARTIDATDATAPTDPPARPTPAAGTSEPTSHPSDAHPSDAQLRRPPRHPRGNTPGTRPHHRRHGRHGRHSTDRPTRARHPRQGRRSQQSHPSDAHPSDAQLRRPH